MLKALLGSGVEAGGGFIEDHEAGVVEEDAGESEELGLARREAGGAGGKPRIEAGGEGAEPFVEAEVGKHLLYFGVGDGAVEKGEVVAHAGVEYLDVLGDQTDVATQVFDEGIAQVDAAELDRACRGVVEAENEAGDGGFAAARATEEAQHFAGAEIEGDIAQDKVVGVVFVAEGHAVEVEGEGAGGDGGAGAILEDAVGVEKVVDAGDTGGGLLEVLHLAGDLLHRVAEEGGVVEGDIEGTDGDLALDEEVAANAEGGGEAEEEEDEGAVPGDAADHGGKALLFKEDTVTQVEAAHGVVDRAAGADVFGGGEALFEVAEEVGAGLPGVFEAGHGEGSERIHEEDAGEATDADGEAHTPVDGQQEDEHSDEEDTVAQEVDHEARKEVAQEGDIAVDALDHFAGGARVVEVGVEAKGVEEKVVAEAVGGGEADVLGDVSFGYGGKLPDEGEAQVEEGQTDEEVEGAGASCAGGGVDEGAEHLGIDQLEGYAAEEEDAEHEGRAPLGPEIDAEEGAEGVAVLRGSGARLGSSSSRAHADIIRVCIGEGNWSVDGGR